MHCSLQMRIHIFQDVTCWFWVLPLYRTELIHQVTSRFQRNCYGNLKFHTSQMVVRYLFECFCNDPVLWQADRLVFHVQATWVYDKWNVRKYLGCIVLTHYNIKSVPEHHFFYNYWATNSSIHKQQCRQHNKIFKKISLKMTM